MAAILDISVFENLKNANDSPLRNLRCEKIESPKKIVRKDYMWLYDV